MRTSLTHLLSTASLALALPSTPDYVANATDIGSGYRVKFSHNCPATTQVFPHFLVTNGTICAKQDNFDQSSQPGEVREYALTYGLEHQSTWTFWIDNKANSTGPNARSLVEVTCLPYSGHCYVDISNIDAVSNGFKVEMDAKNCSTVGPPTKVSPTCDPLVCSIPPDWTCPVENRFGQDSSKGYPPTYLDAAQSCLSNCTLFQTDEACCKNANNTTQTCTNQNPALRDMCENAYSYAFDDSRASYSAEAGTRYSGITSKRLLFDGTEFCHRERLDSDADRTFDYARVDRCIPLMVT
ncbi:uncharacterized protein M437DRAFT_70724 [Aureobasidium melanogenum CBS 110374]|uniref:Osmotin, thaumatin-like protein n=1 Tax=Aureobasidium melanogenum (strain CBS 110374) TaxID=1043003 RepID=A0A074VA81_AURM1|nr:uncharacterized protein M437DRAFT_70724 [Aureobasidium melanogenum CBS 110374]KEQ57535.1 hypothetical protein M437DRAFT_70724 [Aureobasidium melanogenum CBS 110374]